MTATVQTPSRFLRAYAVAMRVLLWLVLSAWLLFALTLGTLHAVIVPRVDQFRPDLERIGTQLLGVVVRIGSIEARSAGLVPSFELRDIALHDAAGRAALRLSRVVVALSAQSLWNLEFEQVVIEGPELDIRRQKDGRVFVGGLEFQPQAGTDSRAADWFFGQPEFVIRGGAVRWTDEARSHIPLALADVDFVLRSSGRRLNMRLDATPPAALGQRFSARALFRQPLLSRHTGNWQEWRGQVFADFARVDLAQLRAHVDLGVKVSEGSGALRAWVDVDRTQVAGATADVALAGVAVTLRPGLDALALQSVTGRLGGKQLPGGFEFSTEGLQFQTGDGLRWPGGNLFVAWTQAEGKGPAQGELRADRLDVAALSQIATRLPLSTATHSALLGFAPKGLVEKVDARWRGALGQPENYQATGRVVNLEFASAPARPAAVGALPAVVTDGPPPVGRPGLRGATLDFDFSNQGGKAKLLVHKGAVDLPGVFEQPKVLLEDLSSDVQWRVSAEQVSVSLPNIKFTNADTQGQAQLSWRSTPAAVRAGKAGARNVPAAEADLGLIDLAGTFARGEGTRVYRYLPLVVHARARDYVREAVLGGTVNNVKFRVKGALKDMPFSDGRSGEFRITAPVRDAVFAYVPASLVPKGSQPWPALTQLNGELIFERNTMQVRGAAARFVGALGLQARRVEAQIGDLTHNPTVVVSAELNGPLTDALALVHTSPLGDMLGHALDKSSATGNADGRLRLVLPILTIEKSKVQGSVTLSGNDVRITPDSPMLERARGVVSFTESGFTLSGVQARILGGEMRLDGGSRASTYAPSTCWV